MKRFALASVAALVVGWLAIFLWVRLPGAPPPLDEATRQAIVAHLRAELEGRPAPPAPAVAEPLVATVYQGGRIVQRGRELQRMPDTQGTRIEVDRIVGRAPVVSRSPFLFAFGVVPGVDGLVLDYGGREEWFMPNDLVADEVLTGLAPFAFMEFEFGVDVPRLTRLAAQRVGASRETWLRTEKRWYRFRTESFIESADQTRLLPVYRANVPGPPLTRKNARAAAIAGGRFLADKLRPDGSFEYEYDTASDRGSSADYAVPRHFGAAMYLAQVGRMTGEPGFQAAAERAFAWFDPHAGEVFESTGSVSLAVLALTEYRLATRNPRYDALLHRMGDFLVGMQRPAGDFAHDVHDRRVKLLYFDGEAAFALTRLARAFDEPRYREAARRALDWLTRDAYGHFAGGFYFGEDHWTCMAAEAAYPMIQSPRYPWFCDKYAAFLRRMQFVPGEGPDDFTGAYGFTPFFPPHNTPAASRTEAMVSSYLLGKHHGHPSEATRQQVLLAFRYLLSQQIRLDNAWLMARPARAVGGWMQSPLRRFVRIDFVQHAGDALLRGEELIPE